MLYSYKVHIYRTTSLIQLNIPMSNFTKTKSHWESAYNNTLLHSLPSSSSSSSWDNAHRLILGKLSLSKERKRIKTLWIYSEAPFYFCSTLSSYSLLLLWHTTRHSLSLSNAKMDLILYLNWKFIVIHGHIY